jgi:glutaminyl-peptide cyclotransferase
MKQANTRQRSAVSRWAAALALGVALLFAGCSRTDGAASSAGRSDAAAASPAAPSPAHPADTAPRARFDGARALQLTKEVVAFGPRSVGSGAHAKLENYLRAHLKADNLEEDAFTASTPAGPKPMRNFIAKFPGTRDGIIVVAGHYDTLFGRNDFVGANDGGSSTGLLLELANELRGKKRAGYSVWLVWLDGEEAIQHWTADDSIYGSRHLAEKWQKDGTLPRLKAFLLVDMIGDADLNIEHDTNSTPWLEELVYQAATRVGYQSRFFRREIAIEDDHMPFVRRNVPSADLIDFDYGYDNAFWHSREDTMDKLSAKSFEITGSVVLEAIRLLDSR